MGAVIVILGVLGAVLLAWAYLSATITIDEWDNTDD